MVSVIQLTISPLLLEREFKTDSHIAYKDSRRGVHDLIQEHDRMIIAHIVKLPIDNYLNTLTL